MAGSCIWLLVATSPYNRSQSAAIQVFSRFDKVLLTQVPLPSFVELSASFHQQIELSCSWLSYQLNELLHSRVNYAPWAWKDSQEKLHLETLPLCQTFKHHIRKMFNEESLSGPVLSQVPLRQNKNVHDVSLGIGF